MREWGFQNLRSLACIWKHVFWTYFDWIISELVLGYCLQAPVLCHTKSRIKPNIFSPQRYELENKQSRQRIQPASLREVRISVDPVESIEMARKPWAVLLTLQLLDSNFRLKVQSVLLHSIVDEGPIKEITVICYKNQRLSLLDMCEPCSQQLEFVGNIDTSEWALELCKTTRSVKTEYVALIL